DAQALSQEEQLALELPGAQTFLSPAVRKQARASENAKPNRGRQGVADKNAPAPGDAGMQAASVDESPAPLFYPLALTCSRIGSTPSKLEKIRLLADYLRTLPSTAAGLPATW